ncbi:uncharacterized protein LOC111086946 [Limulus polyphemus]|uniref:Uncharacterized protein LOC111086946 n=1 Tax=Limulus polyphemus TaxID=6850 RepID=A0ABM1SVA3_LIMPO|nr:uncharacterized protein LOC111086946 [Limulus polyphemus]
MEVYVGDTTVTCWNNSAVEKKEKILQCPPLNILCRTLKHHHFLITTSSDQASSVIETELYKEVTLEVIFSKPTQQDIIQNGVPLKNFKIAAVKKILNLTQIPESWLYKSSLSWTSHYLLTVQWKTKIKSVASERLYQQAYQRIKALSQHGKFCFMYGDNLKATASRVNLVSAPSTSRSASSERYVVLALVIGLLVGIVILAAVNLSFWRYRQRIHPNRNRIHI